jgi:hypothetical protein
MFASNSPKTDINLPGLHGFRGDNDSFCETFIEGQEITSEEPLYFRLSLLTLAGCLQRAWSQKL